MELLFTEIGKVRGEAGLWGDGEELHPGLRNFSLMGLSCDLEGLSGRSRVGMCGVLSPHQRESSAHRFHLEPQDGEGTEGVGVASGTEPAQ